MFCNNKVTHGSFTFLPKKLNSKKQKKLQLFFDFLKYKQYKLTRS